MAFPPFQFPLLTKKSTFELLVMVMLGGQGIVLGPILGAFAYQGKRGYSVTSDFFKDIQLSVSEVLLLLIVLFIPAGVVDWLRQRIPVLLKDNLERVYTMFPRCKERRGQNSGTFSGGEQQMRAVARGIMAEPVILMIDELSLGLAPVLMLDLVESLKALRDL